MPERDCKPAIGRYNSLLIFQLWLLAKGIKQLGNKIVLVDCEWKVFLFMLYAYQADIESVTHAYSEVGHMYKE